jgi:hypothetical protein
MAGEGAEELSVLAEGALGAEESAKLLSSLTDAIKTSLQGVIDALGLDTAGFTKLMDSLGGLEDGTEELGKAVSAAGDGSKAAEISEAVGKAGSDVSKGLENAADALENAGAEGEKASEAAQDVAKQLETDSPAKITEDAKNPDQQVKSKSWLKENPKMALLGLTVGSLGLWVLISGPKGVLDTLLGLADGALKRLAGLLQGVAKAIGSAAGNLVKSFFGNIGNVIGIIAASIGGLLLIGFLIYLYIKYRRSKS